MKILMKTIKAAFIGLLAIAILGTAVFVTAGFMPVRESSSGVKESCYVTVKDGTRLAVRYTLPTGLKTGETVPAVVENTRYLNEKQRSFVLKALLNLKIAKEIPDTVNEAFLKAGYAYVRVDARGSGASFGTRKMEFSREEIDDMGQVIGWIAKQPWSNGKVGAYGISYSGNTAELAAASDQPALRAAAPLYPDFNVFTQSVAPGGIPNEYLVRNWYEEVARMDSNNTGDLFYTGTAPVKGDRSGRLLKEAVKGHDTINISEALKKATYTDDTLTEGYTAESMSPYHYRKQIEKSGIPMYVRVGWMDAGTVNGAVERFLTYKNSQTLVIGPWSHAGWHVCDPFSNSSGSRQQLVSSQIGEVIGFFDRYLKTNDKGSESKKNTIRYYTFGEGKWKTAETWPVPGFENRTLYFASNGSLQDTKPTEVIGADPYKVDFSASTGKTNRWMTNLGGGAILYPDRAGEDKKLLTYTSDPLECDTEITGVPVVTLNVASTAADGAFFTYLEDVAPDGKVTYVTEGQLRALNRKATDTDLGHAVLGPVHSFERKDGELLRPGENTELKIGMYATSVLIRKGHKIRVAIAGHDASVFARIPESGEPILTVQRNHVLSSCIELPMKKRSN